MESFVTQLQKLVNPDFLESELILKEEDATSRLPPIRLKKQGFAPILLRLDKNLEIKCKDGHPAYYEANRRLPPLLNASVKGLTQCCDYALIAQRSMESPVYVVLCELKTNNSDGAADQLKAASLLIHHLLSMVSHHLKRPIPPILWRGVIFSMGSSHKDRLDKPCPYKSRDFPLGTCLFVHLAPRDNYPISYLCS